MGGNVISEVNIFSTKDNPVVIRLTLEDGREAYLYTNTDGAAFGRVDS